MDVTFRRLTDDDLPLLHHWLNEPGVVRWWGGDDVRWDAVVADYGTGGDPRAEQWMALLDGVEVGWLQCYAASAFLDDVDGGHEARAWLASGASTASASIDYLIGPPQRRGSGLGSEVIAAFVEDVVLGRHLDWSQVVVSPQLANVASWRALEKAGFHRLADVPIDGVECRVVVRDR